MAGCSQRVLWLMSLLWAMAGTAFSAVVNLDLQTEYVTCSSTTIYSGTDGDSLDCYGALNGNEGKTWYPIQSSKANCFFTAKYMYPAWWSLDLGRQENVQQLEIHYGQYDQWNDYTSYMRSVLVRLDGDGVYIFPSSTSGITNPMFAKGDLPRLGQLIHILRTTTYGSNYLPLCEVKVKGCADGSYGLYCDKSCSRTCVGTVCHQGTGVCAECNQGFYGSDCTKPCPADCPKGCEQLEGKCPIVDHWRPPIRESGAKFPLIAVAGAIALVAVCIAVVVTGLLMRRHESGAPSKTAKATTK